MGKLENFFVRNISSRESLSINCLSVYESLSIEISLDGNNTDRRFGGHKLHTTGVYVNFINVNFVTKTLNLVKRVVVRYLYTGHDLSCLA